jgi:hypothetical protein
LTLCQFRYLRNSIQGQIYESVEVIVAVIVIVTVIEVTEEIEVIVTAVVHPHTRAIQPAQRR